MNRIFLDIPNDGRKFRAFLGRELVAFIEGDTLYIKTESCNYCGECCMDGPSTIYGDDEEGRCKALVKSGDRWECSAGINVPWRCLGDPQDTPCCSIKYEKIKVR